MSKMRSISCQMHGVKSATFAFVIYSHCSYASREEVAHNAMCSRGCSVLSCNNDYCLSPSSPLARSHLMCMPRMCCICMQPVLGTLRVLVSKGALLCQHVIQVFTAINSARLSIHTTTPYSARCSRAAGAGHAAGSGGGGRGARSVCGRWAARGARGACMRDRARRLRGHQGGAQSACFGPHLIVWRQNCLCGQRLRAPLCWPRTRLSRRRAAAMPRTMPKTTGTAPRFGG